MDWREKVGIEEKLPAKGLKKILFQDHRKVQAVFSLGGDAVRLAAAEINQAVFPQKLCLAVVFVDKAALNDQ